MTMLGLTEMARLTSLIREKTITTFIDDWKPLIVFLHEIAKYELMMCDFDDEGEKLANGGKRELFFVTTE